MAGSGPSPNCSGKGREGERRARFPFAQTGGKGVAQRSFPLGPGSGAGQAASLG